MTGILLLVFVLCLGLAVPALAGPRVLRHAAPTLMRVPRLSVALLSGGVVAWVLAALSIAPLLAWVVTGPDILPDDAAVVCSQCLAAADPFGLDRVDTGVPVALLLAVPVAVSVYQAFAIAGDLVRRRRRSSRTARVFRDFARPVDLYGHRVLVVGDEHPFALTLPRRHGGIVVSTSAVRMLTPDELRAVLAHEAAHLRQRHHLISAVVTTLTGRLHRIPLFAAVEAALGHYLEIAADDAARREVGTTALAGALLTLGQTGHPWAHRQQLHGALHALGPDRIRHLVEPGRGTAGVAAATASVFCLTALALLAAVVHVPYALAVLTGCF